MFFKDNSLVNRVGGLFMKRILIADDAQFMRLAIRKMLEKHDCEIVDEAANGLEAVEKYIKYTPDIVTMDITMPEMDGVQAIREIKKINPDAKILVISAMGQEIHVKEAVMAGASGFIVKPLKEEDIVKSIMRL